MFIAIDVVIIAVMAATVFRAAKRGFVSTLFGLVTLALSVIAAIMFYKELGVYINDKYIFDAVEPHLVGLVENILAENGGEFSAEALFGGLPEEFRSIIDAVGLNIETLFEGAGDVPEQIAHSLAAELSMIISYVASFAVIFFGAYIALSLVCLVLNAIVKLPLLSGVNKILGFVFGVIEALVLGIIIAALGVAACSLYSAVSGDAAFANVLDKTVVAKALLSVCPW